MSLSISRRTGVPALLCCLLLPWAAHAADTLVITGTREPLPIDRLAADVVRIDEETIRASSADSLADLLRREAGLQLSRNGGPGQNSGMFIRGASSGQTVLLVDGVRIGSAAFGQPIPEALGLADIERIEVLRGPASSLYGADAVGGVVQVFTRRGSAGQRLSAAAAVGGYGSREASAALSGAAGGWDHALSVTQERSTGVSALRPGDAFGNYNPDTDGYRRTSVSAQLGYAPAAGHRIGLTLLQTRLNAQYDGSEFLPPDFAQDAGPDFRNRLATGVTALDWRGAYANGLTGTVRASRSVDELDTGGTVIENARTVRDQLTAQLAWRPSVQQQWVLAAEHLDESVRSTGYDAPVDRRAHALVLAWSGTAGGWSGQADLRRDDSSDYGGVTTARLGGSWQLAPALRLRALAGSTFRAPSFNDLYYRFPGGPVYGVPTLRPERGHSVELGALWRAGAGEASATLFRNRVGDLIAYEPDVSLCPDPGYAFGCSRNVSRARLQGLTVAAAHQFGSLTLRGQFDVLDARDAGTGQRLNGRASRQATLTAEQTMGAWSWSASVMHLGTRPDSAGTLAAETTLDLQAAWRMAHGWQLQGKLLNATDRDRQPVRDYQGLGREAWLGVRYSM
jgi:vitamin B12 transporter